MINACRLPRPARPSFCITLRSSHTSAPSALSLSPSISISVCLLAFTSVTGKALCKLKCVEPSAVQHGGICHAAAAELDAVSSSMSLVYAKLLRSITAVSAALLYLNEACHCRVLRHSVDLKLRPASRLYFLFMFLQAVTAYRLRIMSSPCPSRCPVVRPDVCLCQRRLASRNINHLTTLISYPIPHCPQSWL